MGPALARLCLGLGVVWIAFVLFFGLVDGLGMAARIFTLVDPLVGTETREWIYQGMTFLVVPVGLATLLLDVVRDAMAPRWMRAALPGILVALYALVLAAAVPAIGRDLLLAADPVAGLVVSPGRLGTAPTETASWLWRFGAWLAVLAGGPALLGLVADLVAGAPGRR